MTRSLLAGIVLAVCVSPSAGISQSPFSSDVLEITQANFAAAIRGLTAEVKLQSEFRQRIAKYPTAEEYAACQARAKESAEGKKINEVLTSMPDNASSEEMARRMKSYSDRMDVLNKKLCPNAPVELNIPDTLIAIHGQAGLSSGGALTGSAGDEDRPYSVLLERIARGCQLLGTSAPSSGGVVKIAGDGNNVYWIFTSTEMGVLNSTNCQRYTDLSKRLMT